MAYSSEDLHNAIVTYVTSAEEISYSEGSDMFGVPKTTLYDKVVDKFV
jgi:hypothetical protein